MKNLTLFAAIAALAITSLAGAQKTHSPKTHKATHYIGVAKARAVALKKYHGTVVGKIALENEEGKMQYAVNVKSGKTLREVMVDANTGKIANVEVTTKAEEAKEAAAEKKAAHKKISKKGTLKNLKK